MAPPRDRWLAAYWIILLQGLASALPWNCYITETEFFALRAHQAPTILALADNFESVNLLLSTGANMLGFLLYVPLHHVMSLDTQVLWPQVVTLGIMLGSVALSVQRASGAAFMAAILGSQLVMSALNATIMGGVYHMASWLPPNYIQGMSLGVGLAGTAASAISFVTLWAVPRGGGRSPAQAVAPAAFAFFLSAPLCCTVHATCRWGLSAPASFPEPRVHTLPSRMSLPLAQLRPRLSFTSGPSRGAVQPRLVAASQRPARRGPSAAPSSPRSAAPAARALATPGWHRAPPGGEAAPAETRRERREGRARLQAPRWWCWQPSPPTSSSSTCPLCTRTPSQKACPTAWHPCPSVLSLPSASSRPRGTQLRSPGSPAAPQAALRPQAMHVSSACSEGCLPPAATEQQLRPLQRLPAQQPALHILPAGPHPAHALLTQHCWPVVVAEFAPEGGCGDGDGGPRQPPGLRRESASFLRCRTRSMSSDSLAHSLSRSLSEAERLLPADLEPGHASAPSSFLARLSQRQEPAAGAIAEADECSTPSAGSSPPRSQAGGRQRQRQQGQPWALLQASTSDDESPTSPLLLEHGASGGCAAAPAAAAQPPHAPEFGLGGALRPSLCLPEAHHPGCRCCRALADLPRPAGEAGRASSSRAAREGGAPLQPQGGALGLLGAPAPAKPGGAEEEAEDPPLGSVILKLLDYSLILGVGVAVTTATFPGITSSICSARNGATVAPCHATTPHGRFFGDLFVPLMFTVCNASDLLGRLLAGLGPWREAPPPVWAMRAYALLRLPASLPLLFCNVVTPRPWRLPLLFRSDAWPLGVAALLGCTNGHLQSLALMHAPSVLPKGARDRAGPLINLALAAGTTAGFLASFLLTYFLQR